ncbi:mucin-19 [Peromyscus californicus insignis]|uniref:mucin-19 n=1 Tax=Peromyscus californicus insignis TaxID=564181 RepID=UPI0022A694CB|nr:mucin-19 [Peromyscus californicus insignis]
MPARCVVAGRSRRGVRPLWARRWGARMSRGYGVRRRARSSVRRMRCTSIGKLQGGRRALGRRRTTEPTMPHGVNRASGTPGTAGSVEAGMDPGAVWVNGAVGEPEVIGPAGSVWVTRSGKEPDDSSPPSCERKGRPGTLGHESILELWLKVQAMRVASGCWEGSRVELHPVPAGEGPVEKGVPGRASWVETSRGGVTGPWVRGHARTFPRASALPSARGIEAGCERRSIFCRQGQAGKAPPAVGGPGVVEKIGCAASGPWEEKQPVGLPVAIGWSEAVKRSRAGEVMECGGTPGSCWEGQSVQVSGALAEEAVYGPMLWERGQIVGPPDALMVLPRAMEDETASQAATGLWQRRQEVGHMGSRSIPGLRAMGQYVGVPCAREEGARCGGDPGSWGAAQAAELSASEEQEAGSRGAQGPWGIEQAMGAPRALGKEADDASVPGLWGTGQLPGLQTVVVSGDRGEETSYDVSDLWERPQSLGAPLAEALPRPVMEETHSGNLLSLWERRQVIREQEAQGPAALGIPGAMDQDVSCRALSCPCRRRRAVGVCETVVMPKYRCATERVPSALGVPDGLWVCQESSSADAVNLQGRTPVASGKPRAPEEYSSVVEDTESGTLSGSQVGVPMTPEIRGSLEVEAGSGGFSGLSGRRLTVGKPVTAGISPAGVAVAPRTSCSMWEHISSRRVSDSAEGRPPAGVSMTVGLPEATGDEVLAEGLQRRQSASMPVAARIATTVEVPAACGLFGPHRMVDSACGESSGIWQRRQMTDLSTAARIPNLGMEAGSEGVSGLWRRHSGVVPEVVRGALHQGTLAAVEAPVVGRVPAAVWVTGSPREEASGGVSDLTVVRRQSDEGARASGEETGSRGVLGLAGRGQAVGMSYTHELGARMWGSPRSVREETTYENVPRVSAVRTTVPSVSREETGLVHFRENLQGNGGRPVGGVPEAGVRGDDLGERGEGGLKGTFQ